MKKNMCGSPHSIRMRMGHKWLKLKEKKFCVSDTKENGRIANEGSPRGNGDTII